MGPLGRTAVAVSVLYLLFHGAFDRPTAAATVGLVAFVLIPSLAATAFFMAARSARASWLRTGFLGFAASFGFTALGTGITAWQQRILGQDPTYSWSNLPYLLSYPAAMIGVLSLSGSRRGPVDRWRLALDSAVAVLAAIVVTWLYVIVPLAGQSHSWWERALTYSYPTGDLVLFAALVPTLLDPRPSRYLPHLRLLAFGQMTYLAADLGYQLPGTELAWLPVPWTAVVYLVGYVGMIWAAEAFHRAPAPISEVVVPVQASAPRNPLPVILGLVVYALLIVTAGQPGTSHHGVLGVAAVAITGLILARGRLTERENIRLTRALEEQRSVARFRSAIQHLRVGVIVLDGRGRFVVGNPAGLAMLDLSEAEVVGKRLFDSGKQAMREDGTMLALDDNLVTAALATKRPVTDLVVGLLHPQYPDRRWLMVDAHPALGDSGEVLEVVLTMHCITERRALEQQLRQTQRLEAVGRLAGGVAHDFNNLLTAIIGQASLLQGDVAPGDPRAEGLADIRIAADRGASLTRQLLAFSRRQQLRPEVHDLNELVREVERLLARLLLNELELVTELAAEPLAVRIDRGQLEQVIVNLAVNARDAMPDGGVLRISTGRLAARATGFPVGLRGGVEEAATLTVSDTGQGMDEAVQARVFEPFFTTKDVGKGTGLGLSIVFGIVQQSGGEVVVESAPRRGTAVTVYLPLVSSELQVVQGPGRAS